MIKKIINKKSVLFVSIPIIILMYSCRSKSRHQESHTLPESCNAISNLIYNPTTCPETGGCVLEFTCDGNIKPTSGPTPVLMTITNLVYNIPNLLQKEPGSAQPNWFTSTVECERNGNNVKCEQFLPIGDDFTIIGSLADAELDLTIKVENRITLEEECGTAMCGQMGTTIERMYDCSKRVTKYAGFGNGDSTATVFTGVGSTCELGNETCNNPDKNWFLVSSPKVDVSQCFWLSPVMIPDNPAAGENEFDSNQLPMQEHAANPQTQGRLLWSGLSSTKTTVFNVLGKNPLDQEDSYYPFYKYLATNQRVYQHNINGPFDTTGPWIYNPASTESFKITPGSGRLTSWENQNGDDSICNRPTDSAAPGLLNGVYTWQVPSYPMVLTLTGGYSPQQTTPLCEDNVTYIAECNVNNNGEAVGFRAVEDIPNFWAGNTSFNYKTFITGSFVNPSQVYSMNIVSGYVDIWDIDGGSNVLARCVSAVW